MKHIGGRSLLRLVALAAFAAGCTAGAANAVSPSASVTTAIQGWEHYFKLDWSAQDKGNAREIDGYIYNNYGSPAKNVQVLAQALDPTGNLVAQKIEWVPGGVPPLSRSYFRVPGLPRADRYRVTVWAFDFVQTDERRW